MAILPDTVDPSSDPNRVAEARRPGLLVLVSSGATVCKVLPLPRAGLELGRALVDDDARMSKRHARVVVDDGHFVVTDLGSRNGTVVDGLRVEPAQPVRLGRVLRIGDSLLAPVADVDPFQRLGVRVAGERVEGPALQEVLAATARAARAGSVLHIHGESGAGKEAMAGAFHAAGGGKQLVAVNCASIPEGLAERLLFGVKRGAYSGADADADGYLQAAHGGTLFLDEVSELSAAVQAKLLRVLESGEVLPLGAATPRRIDMRFCSATHRDLRAQVIAGKLREDLFFRIGQPRVVVPPLRDRVEEIPFLLASRIAGEARHLVPHVSLIETCLLRRWPGNVRELLAEARAAAQVALAEGAPRVEARHLAPAAGSAFAGVDAPGPPPSRKDRIEIALHEARGNVSAAARALGMHRTQLRRWLERRGIDPRRYDAD